MFLGLDNTADDRRSAGDCMSAETVVTAFPRPPPLKVSLTAGNFHHVILGAKEERELGG